MEPAARLELAPRAYETRAPPVVLRWLGVDREPVARFERAHLRCTRAAQVPTCCTGVVPSARVERAPDQHLGLAPLPLGHEGELRAGRRGGAGPRWCGAPGQGFEPQPRHPECRVLPIRRSGNGGPAGGAPAGPRGQRRRAGPTTGPSARTASNARRGGVRSPLALLRPPQAATVVVQGLRPDQSSRSRRSLDCPARTRPPQRRPR